MAGVSDLMVLYLKTACTDEQNQEQDIAEKTLKTAFADMFGLRTAHPVQQDKRLGSTSSAYNKAMFGAVQQSLSEAKSLSDMVDTLLVDGNELPICPTFDKDKTRLNFMVEGQPLVDTSEEDPQRMTLATVERLRHFTGNNDRQVFAIRRET